MYSGSISINTSLQDTNKECDYPRSATGADPSDRNRYLVEVAIQGNLDESLHQVTKSPFNVREQTSFLDSQHDSSRLCYLPGISGSLLKG